MIDVRQNATNGSYELEMIFCVLDEKSRELSSPFVSKNRGTALRVFTNTVNSGKEGNMLAQYPQDYTLVCVGEFDRSRGITAAGEITRIIRADEVLRVEGK